MANGREKAKQNLASFQAWVATQTDGDLEQIIWDDKLNRTEIAKACGFTKSVLRQNPAVAKLLAELEDRLRESKVLPALTAKAAANKGKPKPYDHTANQRRLDSSNLSALEKKNIELMAENDKLKADKEELEAKVAKLENMLACFKEEAAIRAEMGVMPW
ncbi:hypothetical protein BIZ37_00090 [Photobacterium sp. BZF1]|uniref:VPA1267 family protein n=1 Tax=Photobacterium sp. BZF1 TaxID=1904457 RepID=UPI001653469C|nr:VPA1267 family protein [Photobacterium sp. BZF1]MBC7000937.1 hypothetical protein [Photobacterium sp. BZF1]